MGLIGKVGAGRAGSGEKIGGRDLPSFSTRPHSSHVARPHSTSPIDREPGTGYLRSFSRRRVKEREGKNKVKLDLPA